MMYLVNNWRHDGEAVLIVFRDTAKYRLHRPKLVRLRAHASSSNN